MPFIHSIKVPPEDIDQMGHVNNVMYLRYVQETAEAHWKSFASRSLQNDVLWVVLRHEIDYKKSAMEGEILQCSTWVEEAYGVKMPRFVEIRNSYGDLIVRAKTTWCAIDAITKRPKRIEIELYNQFL